MVAATSGLFSILHAQPLLGRMFLDGDVEPGRDHEVVLSYGFWKSHFGSNPDIVGKNIQLNGQAYTVVGVMKPGFEFPVDSDPRHGAADVEAFGVERSGEGHPRRSQLWGSGAPEAWRHLAASAS